MDDSNWTTEEVHRIVSEISKRSTTDQAFRRSVLEDPNAVIEKMSGKPVPAGFRIDIIESKPDVDQTFVLPSPTTDQLNDQELDNAAGGRARACTGSSGYNDNGCWFCG